jgi:hypothetical protein
VSSEQLGEASGSGLRHHYSQLGCCYSTGRGGKEGVGAGRGKRDHILDGTDPRCVEELGQVVSFYFQWVLM